MPTRRPLPVSLVRRQAWPLALCLAWPVLGQPAWAQQEAGARPLAVTPSVNLGQTVTDNRRDNSLRGGSEAITSIGLGVLVRSRAGAWKGVVDYSLTGLVYARDSSANQLQNRLFAQLSADLLDRRLSLDAQAAVTQQAISALGSQTADDQIDRGNRAEVRSLSLRPTWRSTLAGAVDLQASVMLSGVQSSGNSHANSVSTGADLKLSPASAGARLGWSVDASHQVVDFRQGRKTQTDRVTLGLSAAPLDDLQVFVRGGGESNDLRTVDTQSYANWGAGLLWTPTPRTRVSLDADRRSFGHSHRVSLEHRMRQSVWRYVDSQQLSNGANQTAGGSVTAFALFDELYKSQEPDPVLRAQLVDSLLARNNLQRDSLVRTGFVSAAVTVQRFQELSLAVQNQRTTVVLAATASASRRADTLANVSDDLAGGNQVRQRGLSVSISHRLTPTATLIVAASGNRSEEAAATGRRTELRSFSAFWTQNTGPRTSFSLGVRHSEFDADLNPYTENAVTANLRTSF